MLLCLLNLGAVAPLIQASRPILYEARAIVVAQQLELNSQSLPRYGEAVFNSGSVARDVAADPSIAAEPETLIPGRLQVQTAQDSVVFTVIGRDEDPQVATLIANLASASFLNELNKPGAGIGTFLLQDRARTPTRPANPPLSLPVAVVVGSLAGAALGAGLIMLLVVLRRPIVGDADV